MSVVVDHRGFVSAPSAALQVHGDLARSSGAAGLAWAYPPIPTFLASVLPGGAMALALVSSLLAGVAMASLWERLARRHVSVPLSIALLASLACVPAVLYGATQDLAAFAGLAFLIIALDGFARFIVDHDTRGGFQAGLMLALAFGCDPVALVYAAALAAAAPLLAHARYRSEPDAGVATASVLIFPVAAAAAAWAFLEWRFTGSAFATVIDRGTLFHFSDGVRERARHRHPRHGLGRPPRARLPRRGGTALPAQADRRRRVCPPAGRARRHAVDRSASTRR